MVFLGTLCGHTKGEFCNYDSDCVGLKVCCSYSCHDSCINRSCIIDSDCGGNSYCCNDVSCQESCVGYACDVDSDCGGLDENCCYGKCKNEACLPVWAIVVIAIGCLTVLAIAVISIVFCVCLSYRRRSPGLIVAAPGTAVVTGSNVNYGAVNSLPTASAPPYYEHRDFPRK